MKKFFLSIIVIAVFCLYVVFYHKSTQSALISDGKNSTIADSSLGNSKSTQTVDTIKDGSYAGSAEDAFYGTVQVKAVIQNGKITDIEFLQYPNDRSESVQINQNAIPTLKQEAIQKQSANVDIVSGATQTSDAFNQSLADALVQAK
jgi:uncharacterized protein with FMN-binding domain